MGFFINDVVLHTKRPQVFIILTLMTSYTHFSTGEKPINNFALPSVESGMWWLENVQDFVLKLGMKPYLFTTVKWQTEACVTIEEIKHFSF